MDYLFSFLWQILGLLIVAGIIYSVVRRKSAPNQASSKHGILFVFAGLSYLMAYFGLANLLRIVVEILSGTSTTYTWVDSSTNCVQNSYNYGQSYLDKVCPPTAASSLQTKQEMAIWLALIIVGVPIFLYLWNRISQAIKSSSQEDVVGENNSKIQLTTFFVWMSSLIALAISVWFVYEILLIVLGAATAKLSEFSTPVGYLVTSIPTLLYFLMAARSMTNKTSTPTTSPAQ